MSIQSQQTLNAKYIIVKDRGRKVFEDIDKLAASIKLHGLMHPVVVKKLDENNYQLVAGERRFRACLFAGIVEIPYTLAENITEAQLKEMELEENIQRSDLHWTEKSAILLKLDEIKRTNLSGGTSTTYGDKKGSWTVEDMAKLTGRSIGSVSMDLKLAKDLRENPDIAAKVHKLPKDMARKRTAVLLKEKALAKIMPESALVQDCELFLGDCTELIKSLKDNSVDLLITDPPFACETMNQVGSRIGATYAGGEQNMGSEDKMLALYSILFPELHRVLKPGAHCYIFHAMSWYTRLHAMLTHHGFQVDDQPIIWSKGMGTSKPKDWHYIPAYEPITFAIKLPVGRPLMSPCPNVISIPPIFPTKRIHPLQKPEELLRIFIENSSSIGDTILDPFAGSASTLVAARNTHRKAIGFELDKVNFVAAQEYISKNNEQ